MSGSEGRRGERSGRSGGRVGAGVRRTGGGAGRRSSTFFSPFSSFLPLLIRRVHSVLTSGLDDYPRAIPPHLGELHVDLISWMGFFARTMRDVAEFLGEEEDIEEYEEQFDAIVENIDDLHWSEEEQMYCDASVDEDGAFSTLLLQLPFPLTDKIERLLVGFELV
jgi:hypothetical protein